MLSPRREVTFSHRQTIDRSAAHFRKLVLQNYQNTRIPRLLAFVLKLVGSLFSDEDTRVKDHLIESTLSSGNKELFRVLVDYIKKYKDNKTPIYNRDLEPLICTAINISKDPLHFIRILVEELGVSHSSHLCLTVCTGQGSQSHSAWKQKVLLF